MLRKHKKDIDFSSSLRRRPKVTGEMKSTKNTTQKKPTRKPSKERKESKQAKEKMNDEEESPYCCL